MIAVGFFLAREWRTLCILCHMCKCHVIPYLFVCSVPSWGPHAGCRQAVHGELSSLMLHVTVSLQSDKTFFPWLVHDDLGQFLYNSYSAWIMASTLWGFALFCFFYFTRKKNIQGSWRGVKTFQKTWNTKRRYVISRMASQCVLRGPEPRRTYRPDSHTKVSPSTQEHCRQNVKLKSQSQRLPDKGRQW